MATGLARFGEKLPAHELVEPDIAIVCAAAKQDGSSQELRPVGADDAITALIQGLGAAGLIVDRVVGRNAEQFLKVCVFACTQYRVDSWVQCCVHLLGILFAYCVLLPIARHKTLRCNANTSHKK